MKIEKNIHPPSFQGYDARPLKGLIARGTIRDDNFWALLEEMKSIGKKSGFDVYLQTPDRIITSHFKNSADKSNMFEPIRQYCWPQDYLSFLPDGKAVGLKLIEHANKKIAGVFKRPLKSIIPHIQGGNFFIINRNGKNILLIGENDLSKKKISNIRSQYGIKDIYPISQPDFHIDLAVRPLNKNNILVTDDELTIEQLNAGQKKIEEYLNKNDAPALENIKTMLAGITNSFADFLNNNKLYESPKVIQKELEDFGFNVIKVPGRIIRPLLKGEEDDECYHYLANFMNAIVHQRPNKSLVYITNHSALDEITGISAYIEQKTGFGFEKMFKDSIKDYVKPADIHFVSGNNYITTSLDQLHGGVHCLFTEVPRLDTVI